MTDQESIDLITIEEAVKQTGQIREELLRLGVEGQINLFCMFGTERLEIGEFSIEPIAGNLTEWPPGGGKSPYAYPCPLEATGRNMSDNSFSATLGYSYPDPTPIQLDPRRIQSLLSGNSVFVVYGWMPDGTAFKVVEPDTGLRISTRGLFVSPSAIPYLKEPTENRIEKDSPEKEYLNRKELESFFDPITWNTIKSWAIKSGIPKPEPDKRWEITLKDAVDIKTEHDDYIKRKKNRQK